MTLQELLEAAGFETFSYVGRGVGNWTGCLAVQADNWQQVIAEIGATAEHQGLSVSHLAQLLDCFAAARTDALGYQTVLYFPAIGHGKKL